MARFCVAPGIAILDARLHAAGAYAVTHAMATEMGYQIEWDAAIESLSKMHRRGIRVLPGGDYGFAWNPHGDYAKELTFFLSYVGLDSLTVIR